jgi:CRP-like cAMP-binding protein
MRGGCCLSGPLFGRRSIRLIEPVERSAQHPGSGCRVPLQPLRECFETQEEIRGRVLELVQAQSLALSQIAACNKLHEAEPRLARWLLMIRDRVDSDTIQITRNSLGR